MKTIYAALLLHKLGKAIDEKNLKHVITSAGAEVDEAELKSLVASLKGVDIDKELESASLVSAAPVTVVAVEATVTETALTQKSSKANITETL